MFASKIGIKCTYIIYLFASIYHKYNFTQFYDDHSVETNFISPVGIVRLVKSLLKQRSLEEFRATNQVIFKQFKKSSFQLYF